MKAEKVDQQNLCIGAPRVSHQTKVVPSSIAELALSRFYILINKIVQNLKIFEYIDKLNSWGVLCQL